MARKSHRFCSIHFAQRERVGTRQHESLCQTVWCHRAPIALWNLLGIGCHLFCYQMNKKEVSI